MRRSRSLLGSSHVAELRLGRSPEVSDEISGERKKLGAP